MDPTANLAEQLRLATRIGHLTEKLWAHVDASEQSAAEETRDLIAREAARLAELVEALNTWISGGGFLPAQWQASQVPAPDNRCAQLWTAPSGFPMRCTKSASHTGQCRFGRA